jgi:hypothetical protein
MEIITWFQNNWTDIINLITALVAVASIIVRFTPTLKDDSILLVIVKFLGRYIALNRTVPDNQIREENA